MTSVISRRAVLQGSGALIVSFALPGPVNAAAANDAGAKLPGSLARAPLLDAWIRIDANSKVTAFTGKAELGQGIKTALLQIAAEELMVPLEAVRLVTADTVLTANEGYTAGSHSTQDSGTALRNAAAQAREILVSEAAKRWNLSDNQLKVESGAVMGPSGARLSYGELVSPVLLHVQAQPVSRFRDPASFVVMSKSVPRVDLPAKLTGGSAYVQDVRLPGMLHARVVRPPSYGAQLLSVDVNATSSIAGIVKVIRDGNFLAVVAEREYEAIKAMRALTTGAKWKEHSSLPEQAQLHATLLALPAQELVILQKGPASDQQSPVHTATYTRPYLAHASIGPSCAVAHLQNDTLTVWTHTQGVYPDRQAIAEMLSMSPDKVHCIHVEGSGCYGHNGADDAAGDAAFIARQLPGKPIRVQLMREQEFAWEPFGPAMITKVRATLDASGRIASWDYGVWSNTHSMRPGPAGSLLSAQHMSAAFAPPAPKPLPQPEGGGDRNAIPLYNLPRAKVAHHFIPDMPLRISALRSLGAYMNVFSIESFMDELASAAHADPVAFRLQHLEDPRALDVINTVAARFDWAGRPTGGHGRGCGFSFARYKNLAAYCAVAIEVEVDSASGRTRIERVVAAVDTGQVVNPDGIRNQVEGGILQSLSWTLYESVGFDETRIRSVDWSTYPIMRFDAVPRSLEVHVIDRPGTPFLGCGEASQGPASAAVANAIADATGKRLRELPLSPARVKAAIGT